MKKFLTSGFTINIKNKSPMMLNINAEFGINGVLKFAWGKFAMCCAMCKVNS